MAALTSDLESTQAERQTLTETLAAADREKAALQETLESERNKNNEQVTALQGEVSKGEKMIAKVRVSERVLNCCRRVSSFILILAEGDWSQVQRSSQGPDKGNERAQCHKGGAREAAGRSQESANTPAD